MMAIRLLVLAPALLALLAPQASAPPPMRPDFSSAARLADWEVDGSGTWEIARGLLILSKAGVPAGPIRRPAALAILKSAPFVRVTVDTEMRSTAPLDVTNRDLEIVFGYESPS